MCTVAVRKFNGDFRYIGKMLSGRIRLTYSFIKFCAWSHCPYNQFIPRTHLLYVVEVSSHAAYIDNQCEYRLISAVLDN